MNRIEEKFVLRSKTIWGAIITAIPTVVLALGWDLGDPEVIAGWGNEIIVAIGAILAIYGRITAKGPLNLT